MLGLLHRLKLICAWPYSVSADLRLRNDAPKVKWLLNTLNNIRQSSDDKVIVFTELRDIQRELQHLVSQHFGFKPFIINGDTSTKSGSDQNRQSLIDNFQSSPGFIQQTAHHPFRALKREMQVVEIRTVRVSKPLNNDLFKPFLTFVAICRIQDQRHHIL